MVTVPTPTNLWKLDDNAASTTVVDHVGSANGTASANTDTLSATGKDGKANTAFDFVATSSHDVDLGNSIFSNISEGTISMWFEPDQTAANQFLFSNRNVASTDYLQIVNAGADGSLVTARLDNGATTLSLTGSTSPNTNYNRCTVSWGSSGFKLYVNGILEDSDPSTTGLPTQTTQTAYLGRREAGSYYDGNQEKVKYWSGTQLSDEQVYQDYLNEKDQRNACVLDLKLNEGSGTLARDGSGEGNNGTITDPVWIEGPFSSALDFNSSTTFISGTDIDAFTADFTYIFWAKIPTTNNNDYIFMKGDNGTSGKWTGVWTDTTGNSNISFTIDNGVSATTVISTTSPQDDTWHSFAFKREGSTGYIYIDGILDNSGAVHSDDINTNDSYLIGRRFSASDRYPDMTMSRFMLFTRALTSTEMMEEAYRIRPTGVGGPVSTDSLEAYYPLNGDVLDYSGNGNNGTNNGSTSTNGVAGLIEDGARSFNGSSDFIDTNYRQTFSDYTISLWVYIPATVTGDDCLVGVRDTSSQRIILRLRATNKINFLEIRNDVTISEDYIDNSIVGKWNHIVMTTQKNGNFKGYLDGIEVVSTTVSNNDVILATYDFYIGALNNQGSDQDYCGCTIDDVQILDRYITPEEVRAIYSRSPRVNIQ